MSYSGARVVWLGLVVGAVLLAACGNEEPLVPPVLIVDDPEAFIIDGNVQFLSLEGGCWTILADDGKRYEPMGLPKALEQDGLRVRAAVKLRPDVGSFCMVGTIVEVVEIEPYILG